MKQVLDLRMHEVFGDALDTTRFAVRSSALGEDGHECSAAGQLESYLDQPAEQVSTALLRCWASNFRREVLSYRR